MNTGTSSTCYLHIFEIYICNVQFGYYSRLFTKRAYFGKVCTPGYITCYVRANAHRDCSQFITYSLYSEFITKKCYDIDG